MIVDTEDVYALCYNKHVAIDRFDMMIDDQQEGSDKE